MSWKRVKLSEVLKQYRIEHIVQNDKIYKQVSILNNGSVVLRGEKIGKEIGRKRQFVIDIVKYPNTLIFTRQLLLQGSIGLANEEVNQCIVTENMPMFSVDISRVSFNYLKLFIKSDIFKRQVSKIELSGSAQKSIHERTFLNLEIPLPSIQEQNEVVANFSNSNSHIDLLSSELTHQLTLVKKLRQQLLQDAVQGKLVKQNQSGKHSGETGSELLKKIKAEKEKLIAEGKLKKEKPLPPIKPEEIPFEIPENWVWCRLGEVINLLSGQDLVPSMYSDKKGQGIPYITGASNLDNGKVILNRWTSNPRSIALKGDILLTCKGSGVGKMAILKEKDAHIARQIMGIRSNYLPVEFLSIYLELQADVFKRKAKSLIPGIDRDTVLTLVLPIPPIAVQNRIIEKIFEMMQYCDKLETSIKERQSQNEKLLQQVLREALRKEEVVKP